MLGILCVNSTFFALPLGAVINPHGPTDAPFWDRTAYFIVHTFAEGKFYPLFSMLFGYGLALQLDRVAAAGRSVGWFGVRRLLFLLGVGLLHAILLWYGDILFTYSLVGMICLIFIRASAKTLLITGVSLLLVATTCTGGFGAMSAWSAVQTKAAAEVSVPDASPPIAEAEADQASSAMPTASAETEPVVPAADGSFAQSPMGRFFKELGGRQGSEPGNAFWMKTETTVYRDGPYTQALFMRCMTWVVLMVISVFTYGWHIMAMFCIGAGFAKLRLLEPVNRVWHKRFALAGLCIGVPMCVLGSLLPHYLSAVAGPVASVILLTVFGPVLSLGYLGGMALLVESGAGGGIGRWIASTGRMAFTNYLTQSLVMTFIMYHWGLAKFGSFGRAELLGLAVGIYVVQTLLSNLWLSRFRFGPLEWVWRMWTYGRAERMLR